MPPFSSFSSVQFTNSSGPGGPTPTSIASDAGRRLHVPDAGSGTARPLSVSSVVRRRILRSTCSFAASASRGSAFDYWAPSTPNHKTRETLKSSQPWPGPTSATRGPHSSIEAMTRLRRAQEEQQQQPPNISAQRRCRSSSLYLCSGEVSPPVARPATGAQQRRRAALAPLKPVPIGLVAVVAGRRTALGAGRAAAAAAATELWAHGQGRAWSVGGLNGGLGSAEIRKQTSVRLKVLLSSDDESFRLLPTALSKLSKTALSHKGNHNVTIAGQWKLE